MSAIDNARALVAYELREQEFDPTQHDWTPAEKAAVKPDAPVFWVHSKNLNESGNYRTSLSLSLSDVTNLYNALGDVVGYYEANGITLN